MHYLKFSLFHCLTLMAIVAVMLAQHWIPIAYACITAFVVLGDALFGDDISAPDYKVPRLHDMLLYLALPLLFLLMTASMWLVSDTDLFSLGARLSTLTGYDFLAAKAQTQLWEMAIGVFFIGLMISTIGTIAGHELVHRNWSRRDVTVGRWLLAFSFDSNFSIEHVYGHHRRLGTPDDPATAPRGRNVYQHIILSTVGGNRSAWHIEQARLARRKLPLWSWHNQCLRGFGMSAVLLLLAFGLAGWPGLLYFTLCGLWAKCMLEIVNYMEHYGIVRAANKRVEPRHSWNTNRKISSWAMFNLSRHSHHHAHGQLPYHKLKPFEDSPTMLGGYMATMLLTLIPPLWFRLMAPKLAHWDAHFASDDERALVKASHGD